jgi:hypothetical protein
LARTWGITNRSEAGKEFTYGELSEASKELGYRIGPVKLSSKDFVRPHSYGLLPAIVVVMLSMGSIHAGTILWNNGPVTGDSRWCDSTPTLCGGTGGWTGYDDFTVGASTITGFTYNDFIDDNGQTGDTYLGTNWSVWSSDPSTSAGPIASGTSLAVLTAGSLGSTLFTVTGLNVNLSGGLYWLGIQNIADSQTLTDRGESSGNGLPGFETGDEGGIFNFLTGDTAFTIDGNSIASPEPATGTLTFLLLCIGGMSLRRPMNGGRDRTRT